MISKCNTFCFSCLVVTEKEEVKKWTHKHEDTLKMAVKEGYRHHESVEKQSKFETKIRTKLLQCCPFSAFFILTNKNYCDVRPTQGYPLLIYLGIYMALKNTKQLW